jgi:hypothetical protein
MEFELEPESAAGLPPPRHGVKSVRIGHDAATERWLVVVAAKDREVLHVVIESATPIGEVTPVGFRPGVGGYARFLAGPALEDRSASSGLGSLEACRSLVAGDLDNDRDTDLFVICSDTLLERPNRLLLNDGSGRFEPVADEGGTGGTSRGTAEGVVLMDCDRDGWLDIVVANGAGLRPFNDGPLELYRNAGGSGGWLDVVLHGSASSADALGAIVTLTTDLDHRARLRGGETHAAGQSRPGLHFGLGASRIESLAVAWPSGLRQRFDNVPANHAVHVVETRHRIGRADEPPRDEREETTQ